MNKENFIMSPKETESEVIAFKKDFSLKKEISSALLSVSSLGIYKATVNGM